MGSTVWLYTDSGKDCPYEPHSDFKWLGHYLFGVHIMRWSSWPDVIGSVGEHFNIDLTPLERVFAPNHDGSETAWEATAQPPGELADCLRNLVQVLTDDPSAFAGMELAPSESYLMPEQLQTNCDYFLKGEFLRDLTDLLRMAEWAEESGEERVRLYYG